MIANTIVPPQLGIIEITQRCNLSCLYCYAKSSRRSSRSLSLSTIKGIIKGLKALGTEKITLLGGEILVRDDLDQVFALINKEGFPIRFLITNGTLLTIEKLSLLKSFGISNITVSIDGSSSRIMDRLRGKGTFNTAMRNVKRAITLGFKVTFASTICKINFKDIENIVQLAKQVGAINIGLNHIFFHGRSPCYTHLLKLKPQEQSQVLRKIYELTSRYKAYIEGDYIEQIRIIKDLETNPFLEERILVSPCGAGNKQVFIRADGLVSPCPIIRDVIIGNIREDSLKKIWRYSTKVEWFRKALVIDLRKTTECRDCLYQRLCYTGHRCYPYLLPRGLQDKSFYCIYPWFRRGKAYYNFR